jgi:hypothetical protein
MLNRGGYEQNLCTVQAESKDYMCKRCLYCTRELWNGCMALAAKASCSEPQDANKTTVQGSCTRTLTSRFELNMSASK